MVWTHANTLKTLNTFLVINNRNPVFYRNCTRWANLYTVPTMNAANLTVKALAHLAVSVITNVNNALGIRDKRYKLVWATKHAVTTPHARFRVNKRHALAVNLNSRKRARPNTVATA